LVAQAICISWIPLAAILNVPENAPLGIVIVPELALSPVIYILRVALLLLGTCVGKHNQNSFPLLLKSCAEAADTVNTVMARSIIFLIVFV
jgi:hypothetical protein